MNLELENQYTFGQLTQLESIYFGGGTPSILPPNAIESLLNTAKKYFTWNSNAEITLEANPEDIHQENLLAWKSIGINRLSIGVQSLVQEDLTFMHRNHNAKDAQNAVDLILKTGYTSHNIDLIFGSPWLSNNNWEYNLDWAFNSGADHISAYALTVEPNTFLNKKILKKEWPNVNDKIQAEQYKYLTKKSAKMGWDFYEISNLSKPGHRAIHNSNYWKNKPYLGIGPSAHSYDGNIRKWNISDNKKYTENIHSGAEYYTSEILSTADKYNEYILTNIRTTEGIQLTTLENFEVKNAKEIEKELHHFVSKDLLVFDGDTATLTLEGRLLADWITSELMC